MAEIIELEYKLPNNDDKIALLPHLVAFTERADEFTPVELIDLIKEERTGFALESALIEMYISKKADSAALLELLSDENTTDSTKEYIISKGNYSLEELTKIFNSYDNTVAIIAMKRITALDKELAYSLSFPILTNQSKVTTDEKYIASFLGIASFLEKNRNDAKFIETTNTKLIPAIKKIYNTTDNQSLKDQAIYAIARICDFETFSSIINSDDIDVELKLSTIERNINLMLKKINSSTSNEEISVILDAMKIYPITDIADALEKAIESDKITKSDDIVKTIEYIRQSGIKGVNKYGK